MNTPNPFDVLYSGYKADRWTLPETLVTHCRAIEILTTTPTPDRGRLPAARLTAVEKMRDLAIAGDTEHVANLYAAPSNGHADISFQGAWNSMRSDAVDLVTASAVNAMMGNIGEILIREHLQPAFAEFLDRVRADIKTAGRYARLTTISVDLLTEDDDTRSAVARLYSVDTEYRMFRNGWLAARQRDVMTCVDPLGTDSMLAEIGDYPSHVDNWRPNADSATNVTLKDRDGTPINASHVKLEWAIRNDAVLWLPTAAEQNAAFNHYRPEQPAQRRGFTNPFAFAGRPPAA